MAYAIIRTGGKQYRAESGKTIRIPSLPGEAAVGHTAGQAHARRERLRPDGYAIL